MPYFEDKSSKNTGHIDDLVQEEVQSEDFVFVVNGVTGELKSVFCPDLQDNGQVNNKILQTLRVFGINEIGEQPITIH